MKSFNLRSYIIGVITGIVIIFIIFGVKSLLSPSQDSFSEGGYRSEGIQFQRGGMMNEERLQSMADRLGITLEELKAEMDAGKTLPEIAEERGVEFMRRIPDARFDMPLNGTGATETSNVSSSPGSYETIE